MSRTANSHMYSGLASAALLPDVLISRDDEGAGWDFFSWRVAVEACPELLAARRILMINDSVIGPIASLSPLIERLERSQADVIGFAESADPVPHIQSWGIAFAGEAISGGAVGDYYRRPGMHWSKEEIISHMEIPLGSWFARRGYAVEVICSPVTLGGEQRNPSIFGWQNVLRSGIPFAKRELFISPMQTIGKQPDQVLKTAQQSASIDLEPLVRDSVASVGTRLEVS